jgi:uncharacterized membrane protein
MWILQFLPNWIFPVLFFVGIILYLVTKTISFLPHTKIFQAVAVALIFFSTYMIGAISNNNAWLARVKDLEVKVAQAEAKSANTNTEIVEKTVIKTQIVKQRGQDIIKYVDREIIKFDTSCVIPKEFVLIHNQAAEALKK